LVRREETWLSTVLIENEETSGDLPVGEPPAEQGEDVSLPLRHAPPIEPVHDRKAYALANSVVSTDVLRRPVWFTPGLTESVEGGSS